MSTPLDVGPVPPRWIARGILGVRGLLRGLADRLVPAPLVLLERASGVGQTVLLETAARLDLAERLADGPRSAADLAQATGTNADALERVLRALVAHGIFVRDRDGRFRNNHLSKGLRKDVAGGGPWLAMNFGAPFNLQAWAAFDHAVRTGRSPFELVHERSVWDWYGDHPEDGTTFAAAMRGTTTLTATVLAKACDFGRFGVVCDVAGGWGLVITAILRRHPKVRGLLVDDAAVLAGAEPFLVEHGVRDRCTLAIGDIFAGVPAADAYVLKDILHDWDDERCRAILTNLRQGTVFVVEMLVDPVESDPFVHHTDILMMTLLSEGRQRSLAELDALFRETGFTRRKVTPLAGPYSVIEAVPA